MANKMDTQEFMKKIKGILLSVLNAAGEDGEDFELSMDTKLISGLGTESVELSSIDYVDFLVRVEAEYDVYFDFGTVIYSIQDLYDYIIRFEAEEENT